MRAVVINETGGPEVLSLEEVPDPVPGEGEVLIRVRAAGLNPVDWKFRRGMMPKPLPAILGSDASGVVEASLAEGFSEGEEVFGFVGSGAYAELAIGSPHTLVHKPDHVTHEQAAALPVAALTAFQALFDRAHLKAGQTVLIAGAAGGVGHFAVQLAKNAGAKVIGTGSLRNRDFVLGLGADEYVDYLTESVTERVHDADVVFDTVGGETTATLVPTLRPGGVIVVIAGMPPESEAAAVGARAEMLSMTPDTEELTDIGQLVADGILRVEIEHTLPLADVSEAQGLSETGHVRGKIVLTP